MSVSFTFVIVSWKCYAIGFSRSVCVVIDTLSPGLPIVNPFVVFCLRLRKSVSVLFLFLVDSLMVLDSCVAEKVLWKQYFGVDGGEGLMVAGSWDVGKFKFTQVIALFDLALHILLTFSLALFIVLLRFSTLLVSGAVPILVLSIRMHA